MSNQTKSTLDALIPAPCPKCGGPVECTSRDVGGVSYDDEYVHTCPRCGVVAGPKSVYGGSFSADYDTSTTCPLPHIRPRVGDATLAVSSLPDKASSQVNTLIRQEDSLSHVAALLICEWSAPPGTPRAEIEEAAKKVEILFRSTRNWDDDVYRAGKSPFNDMWYVIAQDMSSPARPPSHEYPTMMDE